MTRALRPDDAAAAIALSDEAGWNQTVADWHFMLTAGEARGQLTPAGALVASALILPYADRVAWIGMVLTTESHRRRGLASENLCWAIDRCAARGLIAGLDATPAGREVYAPLGFTDLWGLQRLRAERPEKLPEPAHRTVIRPMQDDDLAAVAALDGAAFSAGRAPLMAYLRASLPGCAWVAESGRSGELAGFVLGRPGQLTTHIGPLVARDPEVATALAARALAQVASPGSGLEPEAGRGLGPEPASAPAHGYRSTCPMAKACFGRACSRRGSRRCARSPACCVAKWRRSAGPS